MKSSIKLAIAALAIPVATFAQTSTLPVLGYAKSSVNTAVFRGNSLATFGRTQYVAYYDSLGKVVLAKRTLGTTTWESKTTTFTSDPTDAHNSISIGVDGEGYLHMSWDMHGKALKYARSNSPGSLDLSTATMVGGTLEASVTYPQFLRMQDGNMIFLYRDGSSGNGNLVLNRYDAKSKKWSRVHDKLIDGEGTRNAYWEAYLDQNGVLHVGWVWRETADVATNHDQCYARSKDGGTTWEKSNGDRYAVPITATTAEYAVKIPQKSELINQTSIHADDKGRPYIANYWTPAGSTVPQYQLVYNDGSAWKTVQVSHRTTAFSLSGVGTKKIPIARPQIVVDGSRDSIMACLIFRDVERADKVSVTWTTNLARNSWNVADLTDYGVSSWEPSFDADLWMSSKILDIFVQNAGQGDGETTVELAPQKVTVLEWVPPLPVAGLAFKRREPSNGSTPNFDASGRKASGTVGGSRVGLAPGEATISVK